MFIAVGVIALYVIVIIVAAVLLIYFFAKRLEDKDKETFEKRDN